MRGKKARALRRKVKARTGIAADTFEYRVHKNTRQVRCFGGRATYQALKKAVRGTT